MTTAELLHDWNLTPAEAIALQKSLARSVKIKQFDVSRCRLVGGVDCAPSRDMKYYYAVALIWDRDKRRVVESHLAKAPLNFPYIPGLLSFREIPAILNAVAQLKREPDVIMVDGHGMAHPRRFGIACHLGVLLDRPTLGCGKKRLYGFYHEPENEVGAVSSLLSRSGEEIGRVVRTKHNVKPVIVSVGHRMDLNSAVELVLSCDEGYRLPEPTRQADRLVALKEDYAQTLDFGI